MEYNSAFFGLYEKVFLVLKENLGEEEALGLFRKITEKGLKSAYDKSGFTRGNPEDFVRVVGERDKSVGLEVEFPEVTDSKIIYRFYTDPFPNLKGKVDWKKLVDTYMAFKVSYLLGDDWTYKTSQHIWENSYTEHIISKK